MNFEPQTYEELIRMMTESATLFSSNSSLGRHSAKRSFISLAQMVLSDGFDAMSFACFMST